MTRFETPRVAIIGCGQIGRGWAALAVSNGWPVAIYEPDADILAQANEEIGERVMTLVRLGRAEASVAEDSLNLMRIGRSLLHAVTDADWIIEAVPEELAAKQKALEQVEQVARLAAIITSSSSGLPPSVLSARLRRPERVLVAHPLNPVELLPLVEVIPGPNTEGSCVEDVRFWLSLLGRAPIVLRKEIPGNFVGRIEAAVWRECIHMVLEGVLDVEDVDRAMTVGPSLSWVAAGPHLDHHLAAGDWGVEVFLAQLLGTYEEWWSKLADWQKLSPDDQHRLVRLIEKAYAAHIPELREARNTRLVRLLEALRE